MQYLVRAFHCLAVDDLRNAQINPGEVVDRDNAGRFDLIGCGCFRCFRLGLRIRRRRGLRRGLQRIAIFRDERLDLLRIDTLIKYQYN